MQMRAPHSLIFRLKPNCMLHRFNYNVDDVGDQIWPRGVLAVCPHGGDGGSSPGEGGSQEADHC